MDRAFLATVPSLRLICFTATGTNQVDLNAARERGIAVANVVRYATPAVVQHVFALILALTSLACPSITARSPAVPGSSMSTSA